MATLRGKQKMRIESVAKSPPARAWRRLGFQPLYAVFRLPASAHPPILWAARCRAFPAQNLGFRLDSDGRLRRGCSGKRVG